MSRIANIYAFLALAFSTALTGCSSDSPDSPNPDPTPATGAGLAADNVEAPALDTEIAPWMGEKADDAAADKPGVDVGVYYENTSFTSTITVTFNGAQAVVDNPLSSVYVRQDGAYVTLDLKTNKVPGVKIVARGYSLDGSLKIYGKQPVLLQLNNLQLASQRGPAINNQCKKPLFVNLAEGTTNTLTDAQAYADDAYYLPGSIASDEDRKGCFFSEGNTTINGAGVLQVAGRFKHAIAVDGALTIRPGATVVVTEAASNGIQAKGDTEIARGFTMLGGLLYVNVASTAGKAIKTDVNVDVVGGKMLLNTSGNSQYVEAEGDTSSPSCIKADGEVSITGGTHVLKSTGTGGKGINTVGGFTLGRDASLTITTTGARYVYSDQINSSSKAIKSDGDITLGGTLKAATFARSKGTEAIETKASLAITGGSVLAYSYDDAINVANNIEITGGEVYALSVASDGIDTNGTIAIKGGTVTAFGGSTPESSIDAPSSAAFNVSGGTLIGLAGALQCYPSEGNSQCSVVVDNLEAALNSELSLATADGQVIAKAKMPRTFEGCKLVVSSPKLVADKTYRLTVDGTAAATFTPAGSLTLVGD